METSRLNFRNVIISGAGQTGSSLVASIIARNRYWINQESIVSRIGISK